MTNHRRVAVVLAAAVSCAVLDGCGGSNSKSNPGLNQTLPPTTSSVPASSTSAVTTAPVDPASSAVLDAYNAYVKVKVQMYDSGSFSKDLKTVAYGKEVQTLTNSITLLRQSSIAYDGGAPNSNPAVTSVKDNTATVHDCFGSTTWIPKYIAGPNKGQSAVAKGSTVSAHPLTATLNKLQDGHWYVVETSIQEATC